MDEQHERLTRLAERAENDPFFVGSALAAFRRIEGMDGAALAAFLQCDQADLPRLALCRRPEGDSPVFGREVNQVAVYAGCEPLPLANLLRAVSAAERMRAAGPGALLAARDRISEERSDYGAPTPESHETPEQNP